MRISVIGSCCDGLVAVTCFADSGNDVVCVDLDTKKVEALKAGQIPICEHPEFERMKSLMKAPVIFDGRSNYPPTAMREMGFSIGRR